MWIRSSSERARALPHNTQVIASRRDDFPAPLGPLKQASSSPLKLSGSGARYARKFRSSRRIGSMGRNPSHEYGMWYQYTCSIGHMLMSGLCHHVYTKSLLTNNTPRYILSL